MVAPAPWAAGWRAHGCGTTSTYRSAGNGSAARQALQVEEGPERREATHPRTPEPERGRSLPPMARAGAVADPPRGHRLPGRDRGPGGPAASGHHQREPGEPLTSPEGFRTCVTIHPSAILRIPEPENREAEAHRFVDDLRRAARIAHHAARAREEETTR